MGWLQRLTAGVPRAHSAPRASDVAATGRERNLGLDGLRGVAILLVLAWHLQLPLFRSAGVVGVAMFFGLSGYLITSILLREHAVAQTIRFGRFYLRRTLRLLPALVVLIVFALVAAYLGAWGDRFHLIGQRSDPHALLASADICVLSSASEGLGSSILAAMALEVPVVATRVGGIPELLGSGAGLMVPRGDAAAFADAVRRVLTEPDLRQNLIRKGLLEAQQYSVSGMAERMLGVYRSCVHSLEGS